MRRCDCRACLTFRSICSPPLPSSLHPHKSCCSRVGCEGRRNLKNSACSCRSEKRDPKSVIGRHASIHTGHYPRRISGAVRTPQKHSRVHHQLQTCTATLVSANTTPWVALLQQYHGLLLRLRTTTLQQIRSHDPLVFLPFTLALCSLGHDLQTS